MNNYVYQGHLARKRFGQNFLNDSCIIEHIVTAIHPQPEEAMVEIGPGLGAITESVSKHLNALTVIELDYNLAIRLRMHSFFGHKLTVYQQDAMTFNFFSLMAKKGQQLRIFGSLPYNISTPLIFYLFNYVDAIKDMHFLLQKEVVNRLVAAPNSKSYGRLSVMAQYYCHIIQVLEVPSECFRPIPKVNSAIVRMIPHKMHQYPVTDIRMLNRITTEAFGKRRKILYNSLGHLFSSEILERLEINGYLRAENLTVVQYCQLANWLAAQT